MSADAPGARSDGGDDAESDLDEATRRVRSPFPERVRTSRLRLDRLSPGGVDVREYYDALSGAEAEPVARYLTRDPFETPKDPFDDLREEREKWEAAERAEWAVRPGPNEEGAGEFAGVATLITRWDRRTAVLGIWLRKPFWGRGYSGERAAAMFHLAFDRFDLDVATAGCLAGNERSKRAIEKYVERFGGRYEGLLRNWVPTPDGGAADMHRYTVSREEYAAAVAGGEAVDVEVAARRATDGETPKEMR